MIMIGSGGFMLEFICVWENFFLQIVQEIKGTIIFLTFPRYYIISDE